MNPETPRRGAGTEHSRLLQRIRRLAAAVAAGLLLCLLALPALADDEDAPSPPDAAAQAAGARWTIGTVSLLAGFGVYYFIQRHRVMNSRNHTPDWDKKMGIGAIGFALVSTVAVWGILSAFSRPAHPPTLARSAPDASKASRTKTPVQ